MSALLCLEKDMHNYIKELLIDRANVLTEDELEEFELIQALLAEDEDGGYTDVLMDNDGLFDHGMDILANAGADTEKYFVHIEVKSLIQE